MQNVETIAVAVLISKFALMYYVMYRQMKANDYNKVIIKNLTNRDRGMQYKYEVEMLRTEMHKKLEYISQLEATIKMMGSDMDNETGILYYHDGFEAWYLEVRKRHFMIPTGCGFVNYPIDKNSSTEVTIKDFIVHDYVEKCHYVFDTVKMEWKRL